MNIFYEWGFTNTPFETEPLTPDEKGRILLIDRKEDLIKIKRRLSSFSNIVTIEGNNGVGKTSLINIASFELYKEHLETGEGLFFIPCDTNFQLMPDKNTEDFIDEVLTSVAQTLIRRGKELKQIGYSLEGSKSIKSWLNAPQVSSYNGSANATFFGIGIGKSTVTNTSIGFQRSGFRIAILDWLREIFPHSTNGGVVCVIDNLELLQTSDAARKQIEQLRDTLFGYTGLRWVLCGALGIVMGVASSPRLQGRMTAPIEIQGIDAKYASEILLSRIKAKEINEGKGYLPISGQHFMHLYKILNNNIRNALNYVSNYCLWVADEGLYPESDEEKKYTYLKWLEDQSYRKVDAIKSQIRPRAFEVFRRCIELGGAFSPSDFEEFGFKSLPAMRAHIAQLEKVGLVVSSVDESDKRRKTIQVTAEGWFFNYGLLSQNNMSQGLR